MPMVDEGAREPDLDARIGTRNHGQSPIFTDDPWATSRAGPPTAEIEGWGISNFQIPDVIAYRMQLRNEPGTQPEHRIKHISPVAPAHKQRYYDQLKDETANEPLRARRHKDAEERKARFLAFLTAGHRIAECCEHIGISQQTYTKWRATDIDFKAQADAIKRGRWENARWDGTFTGARAHFFGYDSYTHHRLIIQAIEDTPPGGVTMILLPPEAGKTSLLEDYCCHRVAEDPNYRILYVTETAEGHARKVLSTIKERMTDPTMVDDNAPSARIAEWIQRFGPFHDASQDKDKPWNQDYIKVHKASGRRDYTVQVAGWKSRIYGARCDLLVFDDVQSDASLGQTLQMLRTIRRTFLSRPGKKGKTIFIGTRIGVGDVYEKLIEENVVDRLVQLPALDEEGHSYCPEMWPEDELARKRVQVGEDAWWAAYMQQPQLAEDGTFTDEIMDACKHLDLRACVRPEPSDNLKVVAGLDPALGGGNAITVAAYDMTRFRLVDIQIDYKLMRNEDIFARLQEMCRYRFTELVVEKNSQQRGIARDDRLRTMATKMGFRIVEHETTAQGKWDFNFGVGAMAGSFIRKEVQIPWGDDLSERRMTPLLNELRAWRPGLTPKLQRQDMVMSTWFVWLRWQKDRQGMLHSTNEWSTRGTPWRPGDMSGRWGRRSA